MNSRQCYKLLNRAVVDDDDRKPTSVVVSEHIFMVIKHRSTLVIDLEDQVQTMVS